MIHHEHDPTDIGASLPKRHAKTPSRRRSDVLDLGPCMSVPAPRIAKDNAIGRGETWIDRVDAAKENDGRGGDHSGRGAWVGSGIRGLRPRHPVPQPRVIQPRSIRTRGLQTEQRGPRSHRSHRVCAARQKGADILDLSPFGTVPFPSIAERISSRTAAEEDHSARVRRRRQAHDRYELQDCVGDLRPFGAVPSPRVTKQVGAGRAAK